MVGSSKTKSKGTESIKTTIQWFGNYERWLHATRVFLMKVEVFAAAKGFKKAMMEDRVKEEWIDKEKLTEEEMALKKQDADAKQFLIFSCSGNALDIIASHETAFGMYQVMKSRYDLKKTKDLVKATIKLEI